MKYIKTFEGYADSHQHRFDRAIYKTYVERGKNFKYVSKEIFYKLLGDKIDKNQTISFDKTRIYRLADEKTMCLSKGGTILGEIWKEEDIASYWINNDIFNHY